MFPPLAAAVLDGLIFAFFSLCPARKMLRLDQTNASFSAGNRLKDGSLERWPNAVAIIRRGLV